MSEPNDPEIFCSSCHDRLTDCQVHGIFTRVNCVECGRECLGYGGYRLKSKSPWEYRWDALKAFLKDSKGRKYLTVTPAVVLQKMADLEETT